MDGYQVQFSVHQGAKRLIMAARDITRDRLEAIFKIEPTSMYLEDDITRETFFPDTNGVFDTSIMRDRGSFAVSGTAKEALAGPSTSTSAPTTPTVTPVLPVPSTRPRSGGHPSNTFQNPLRRATSVRKQIYVADVLDSGKISAYTTVHVTICEGQGVQMVGQTVQEYLNSADSYTIRDTKGIVISDTAETKDLEFWKIPSRKLYAIKNQDLSKPKTGRLESTTKKKRMDLEENEVLDGLQEVELEIKNATARVSENLDEKFNELQISVGHINTNVLQMVQQCEVLQEVKERVSEMSMTLQIASCLRQALTCRMCTAIPDTVLVVTVCCGQVAGCGPCVQTYISGNDTCLLSNLRTAQIPPHFFPPAVEIADEYIRNGGSLTFPTPFGRDPLDGHPELQVQRETLLCPGHYEDVFYSCLTGRGEMFLEALETYMNITNRLEQ